ncbi:MAG: hypothetical protein AAGI46_10495 [Planctomycetota bacterium]
MRHRRRHLELLIVLLALVVAPIASAQEGGGRVTSLGVGGFYDPYAWLPYQVSVRAPEGRAGTYRLRAITTDLDGDRVHFDRAISLAGGNEQSFWGYLKLPPGTSRLVAEEDLAFALVDAEGEELTRLDIQARPIDNIHSLGGRRGGRLVLMVGGEAGGFYPGASELVDGVAGLTGVTVPASVRPTDLPDSAIGYESVFAVVWQDGDPADLLDGGGERMAALREYIQTGGRLVVTHRSDWEALQLFMDILPVTPVAAVDLPSAVTLARIPPSPSREMIDALASIEGSVRHVVAAPKDDAIVEVWFRPGEGDFEDALVDGAAPLLARSGYGFGSVTWLAIDLSNRRLLGTREARVEGWTDLWARIFDTGDRPVLDPSDQERARFETAAQRDFATAPQADATLAARGAALVTLAVVFFIVYWLVAGPGVFFFLKRRKKASMTWWFYGAIGLGAAGMTVLLTGLVLRGPAELRHVSVMRAGPMAERAIFSDLGLYIPREGAQALEVRREDDPADGYLTPLIPPRDRSLKGRASPVTYDVALAGRAEVTVPYRSSLKKFESRTSAPAMAGLEGTLRLPSDSRYPVGQLVNATGYELVNVHVAYKFFFGGRPQVQVLYLPSIPAGGTVPSLRDEFDTSQRRNFVSATRGNRTGPAREEPVEGRLDQDWAYRYWYELPGVRRSVVSTEEFDDWSRPYRIAPAILSFFSMLPPMTNPTQQNDAVALLNRGASEWDVTAAISAGHVVIVAEARETDTPVPMTVNGRVVEGTGTVVTQFVLPINRPPQRPLQDARNQSDADEDNQP